MWNDWGDKEKERKRLTIPRLELGIFRVSGERVSHCTIRSTNHFSPFYYIKCNMTKPWFINKNVKLNDDTTRHNISQTMIEQISAITKQDSIHSSHMTNPFSTSLFPRIAKINVFTKKTAKESQIQFIQNCLLVPMCPISNFPNRLQ